MERRSPPVQLHLGAQENAVDQTADFGQVEFRTHRAGGTEGDAGEFETGGDLLGGTGHQLEGVGAHAGVALVRQHFQAVAHGAHGADQIVADPADEQGGEFDVVHGASRTASL